ncbi:hypothetical protein VTO42DRAFT_6408 [Malbranchea cinnamomea]
MKFSIAAAALALAGFAVAAPGYSAHPPSTEVEFEHENQNICGRAQLNCCNKEITKISGDKGHELHGILDSLLEIGDIQNVGIFDQCSKLDLQVPIIGVPIQDLINQKCKATAACCQQTGSNAEGLVAVGLPCLPINLL